MDLPRPEVTVTDPRQPGVLLPFLEPPPARLGRRGAALLAAAALAGATALVGADVVRDRREAVAVDVADDHPPPPRQPDAPEPEPRGRTPAEPLGAGLRLVGTVASAEDRAVVLRVHVANEGPAAARLLSLVPARGLVVESVAGDASGLPLLLPRPAGGLVVERTLEVRLAVVCGALIGVDRARPFEELSAIVEDDSRSQMTAVPLPAHDPGLQLRQLAGRTCSWG